MLVGLKIYRKQREVLDFLRSLRRVLGEDVFDFEIEEWDFWTEDELKTLGKMAYHPKNFVFGDEGEDYSSW